MTHIPMDHADFWAMLDQWVTQHEITIDRPAGSAHPRYPEVIYPLDYGYLEETKSADGDGIDIWRGNNGDDVNAVIVTLDSLKRDAEIKVLIGVTPQEQQRILHFHQGGEQVAMLIPRPTM